MLVRSIPCGHRIASHNVSELFRRLCNLFLHYRIDFEEKKRKDSAYLKVQGTSETGSCKKEYDGVSVTRQRVPSKVSYLSFGFSVCLYRPCFSPKAIVGSYA